MTVNEKYKCQLCSRQAELVYKKFPGYQEPDLYDIYYCSNCDTSFSSPKDDSKSIYDLIYKYGDTVPGYSRYWNYSKSIAGVEKPLSFLAEKEEAYWGVRESLSRFVLDNKEAEILEIGSGLGYLTYALRKEGYNCHGLEISSDAVKSANASFGNYYYCHDLFEYSILNSGFYDIVILTEVIEHLTDPITFIESAIKLLKPEGKIIITTPNKSIYPASYYWETDLPPVHFWWFSEKSMHALAGKMGLNIEFINFSGFYKRNTKTLNLNQILDKDSKKSVFNKYGELLIKDLSNKKSHRNTIKDVVFKIPYFKTIYLKTRNLIDSKLILAGRKSIILCVILSQKS